MLRPEVVVEPARAWKVAGAWDDLALRCSRPYAAPGWMLPWWEHLAPAGAQLCLALAWDGDDLAGVAPMHAVRRGGATWLRPLAWSTSHRVEPLTRPGAEDAVGRALAAALASTRPAVAALEALPDDSPLPRLLASGWPGGPARVVLGRMNEAPIVRAEPGAGGPWLDRQTRNLRSQIRRMGRRLEEAGARLERVEGAEAVRAALPDFARLHHARWAHRGGSAALRPPVERMLAAAAGSLPSGRMWLWTIRHGEQVVASEIFLGAGDEAVYWLGGHDEAWSRFKPGLVTLAAAIEDAVDRGAARFDLGPGAQDYKLRLADDSMRLIWATLVPPGRAGAAAYAWLAAERVRRRVRER